MSIQNSPLSDEILEAIEARNKVGSPGDLDVPALIKEIKGLRKLQDERYEHERSFFEEQAMLVDKLRSDNQNLKEEVSRLKAEENSRLEYVSHAASKVLKVEEERDEALKIIGGSICDEFRTRGSSGALKAKELQKARLKVIELGRRMKAANKTVWDRHVAGERIGPDLVARDQAAGEWEEAMDTLDKLEATNDPKPTQSGEAGRSAPEPGYDKELQEARMKVADAVQKMRQVNKEYDDDATVHKTAKNELESALHALEELERKQPAKAEANPLKPWDFKKLSTEFPEFRRSVPSPAPVDPGELERARNRVVETGERRRRAIKQYEEALSANRVSQDEFASALKELERIQTATSSPAGRSAAPKADAMMDYKQAPSPCKVSIFEEHHSRELEKAQAQIIKQANLMATLMKEVLRLGSELSAAQKKAKEGKEAP